jgi:hypothetical protein
MRDTCQRKRVQMDRRKYQHGHQEADVNLHVQQKRHGRTAAQHLSLQGRQHQERQPGQQRDDEDALAHQQQRVVGQVRPAQKLEERPAQDQREVRRLPEQTDAGPWGAGVHLRPLRRGGYRVVHPDPIMLWPMAQHLPLP